MKTKKTKVLFLIEKSVDEFTGRDEKIEGGVAYAYFPEEVHNTTIFDGKIVNIMTCYAHVGQHAACHPDYAKECKEANYDDYHDLKIELEGIGYKLEVLNKDFARQDAINKGKVWQVYYKSNKEDYLFEGAKTRCKNFLRENGLNRAYNSGLIRLAKVIYEPSNLTV